MAHTPLFFCSSLPPAPTQSDRYTEYLAPSVDELCRALEIRATDLRHQAEDAEGRAYRAELRYNSLAHCSLLLGLWAACATLVAISMWVTR